METKVIKEYINIDNVANEILNIYKAALDGYEEHEKNFINDSHDLKQEAFELALQLNENMNEYLHKKDHKIDGNFNNIDYDYIHFRTGEFNYDYDMVNEMIARLDNQEESEQAKADREFLSDWIFETFGTFGFEYNFTSTINDELYIKFECNND